MKCFIDVYIKYVSKKVGTAVTPTEQNDFTLITILYSRFTDILAIIHFYEIFFVSDILK